MGFGSKVVTNEEVVDRLVAEAGSPGKGVFAEVGETLNMQVKSSIF